MVFCFALYPFTRGRAPTVQVFLACAILFCIISLQTWSCTHCSCCPSVWYFFALYTFTRDRALTVQVVLAYGIWFCIISLLTWSCTVQVVLAYGILFCIISLHTWSCTHCSSCPSVWYFVLHYIPSHVVIHAFTRALYSFSRRARTVQVVLAYGILFYIISLHTCSCRHRSSCPSVCYFVLHYTVSHVVVHAQFMLS